MKIFLNIAIASLSIVNFLNYHFNIHNFETHLEIKRIRNRLIKIKNSENSKFSNSVNR